MCPRDTTELREQSDVPQTCPDGHVYFIQGVNGGPVKIGWALDPEERRQELQCGSPVRLEIRATTPGTRSFERELHARFHEHRLHGEWFTPTAELENVAEVRLRPNGVVVLRPEDGGPAEPRPLTDDVDATIVEAARGRGWFTCADLRSALQMEGDRTLGGRLTRLKKHGWMTTRKIQRWQEGAWRNREWIETEWCLREEAA